MRLTFTLACLLLSATTRADGVSFKESVAPLLTQRCVMCHIPGAAQAGLALYPEPWKALVGAPSTQSPLLLVKSGEPEQSYLYLKVIGTQEQAGGNGLQMPFQQGVLDPEQMEMIRGWIEQGALNN